MYWREKSMLQCTCINIKQSTFWKNFFNNIQILLGNKYMYDLMLYDINV